MKYDFDTVIDRRHTNSLKYDFALERGKPADVLPLWVADMDFVTAPEIRARLQQAVEHGIFGYSEGKEEYFAAVAGWYEQRFGWKVQQSWLVKTPGVVFALAMAVRAFTREGDAVLIQQPVYYPFAEVIEDNHRRVVSNSLQLKGERYEIDFEDFEQKIVENQVKLFILCSPHNPVGRVWEQEELLRMGEICQKYQVLVVSDEIHSDFVWEGHRHYVFANLSKEFANRTITCTAPTKTFNLAGLQISNIFISNPQLRQDFRREVAAAGYSQPNAMGLVACQAAYEEGEEWLTQCKEYIWDNYLYLADFAEKYLPGVKVLKPEGTYLIWMDFRDLRLSVEELEDRILHKAGLWLDSGAIFGADGEGFERINIACPRVILQEALERCKRIYNSSEIAAN